MYEVVDFPGVFPKDMAENKSQLIQYLQLLHAIWKEWSSLMALILGKSLNQVFRDIWVSLNLDIPEYTSVPKVKKVSAFAPSIWIVGVPCSWQKPKQTC